MATNEDYVLGTHADELHRLGIQHQVWAKEAHKGWQRAGFKRGDVLLDLGSGPGFCTKELAFIAGDEGKVIAVDKAENYIRFLKAVRDQYHLNIEMQHAEFVDATLEPASLDGVFIRWALAWVPEVNALVQKLYQSMKPGSKMVIHEYINWLTHKTEPSYPGLNKAIQAAFDSFQGSGGDINIGMKLPKMLASTGFTVESVRPISIIARPTDFAWQWPRSFYDVYFPALVDMEYLTTNEVNQALKDVAKLEADSNSLFYGPAVVEIIVEK